MIRDENLRNTFDYSEGQKAAAHRVLVELVNLFDEYRDEIRIVGGWVPDLMFSGEGHVGSVDVDVLINHTKLKDSGYLTMSKILLRNGYGRYCQLGSIRTERELSFRGYIQHCDERRFGCTKILPKDC